MNTHEKFVRRSGLKPLTFEESIQYLKLKYGPEYAQKLKSHHKDDLKGRVRRIEKKALRAYRDDYH